MANATKNNTGMWIVAGAAIAGLAAVFMNQKARSKVVDTSMNMKNSVTDYAASIKEDPMAVKDSLIERIKRTSSITMEAVSKIQDILNNQGQQIKETATNIVDESKDIMSTAMDAKEDLMDVKDKAMDAKEALTDGSMSKSESKSSSSDKQLSRTGGEKPMEPFSEDPVKRAGANTGFDADNNPIDRTTK